MNTDAFNTLVFATGNKHKADEIRMAFQSAESIRIPEDLGHVFHVEETGNSLKENAALKAEAAWQLTGLPSFADDTGLFCEALEGAPGIHAARFAKFAHYQGSNNELLLHRLKDVQERSARFESVFCLRWKEGKVYFTGVLEGQIADQPNGNGGFGYDPVFIPQGFQQTLAALPGHVKLAISHRTQALRAMQAWIQAVLSV
ncbi:MAG: Non-canonical purine pyrophosphatase [Bacteroidota bacterium]|jgi:XTP/dITP diphosphohydrolase